MGLTFIKDEPKINFTGVRRACIIASSVAILIGLLSLTFKGGPNYGIDFAGGLMVQVKFQKAADLDALRAALTPLDLPGMVVQRFGEEGDNAYLIRAGQPETGAETVKQAINTALASLNLGHDIQRVEMVGPAVGADLRNKALEAIFYAVLLISIYISGRFEQRWMAGAVMAGALVMAVYVLTLIGVPTAGLALAAIVVTLAVCWKMRLNYALGAVIALIHDLLITAGAFSLMNKEFDLTTVAAFLTIMGYSLNDTIIVFDRIRENLHDKNMKGMEDIINRSINQTLSRTILTSGTVLLVVGCLYLFGGPANADFALAMLIGIGVGTYSSIYIASPILLLFPEEGDARPA